MPHTLLSGRERVRLALAHKETDRIPIAMVCSGINEPARTGFEAYVQSKCRCSLETYLNSIIDIKGVAPQYIGPRLEPGSDIWGVQRRSVQCGLGAYHEIERSPLARAVNMDDLVHHPWPSADMYDYTVLPERIGTTQVDGKPTVPIQEFFVLTRRLESAKGVRRSTVLSVEKKKDSSGRFFCCYKWLS